MSEQCITAITVDAARLPEVAKWAHGLEMRIPSEIAQQLRTASEEFADPAVKLSTTAAAGKHRMRAAFTPLPPTSARLPLSYRVLPGPVRRLAGHMIGRLQRARQVHWARFPGWPVDLSADLLADLGGEPGITFERTPVLLTHDIDSAEGLEHLVRMFLLVEEAVGARSANYVVPCEWPLDHGLLGELARRGHEIGVHGYDHANRTPFADGTERRRRLVAGRAFGDTYGAIGYRAPSLLRTASLLHDLAALYRYDSSIPTSGGPFPVPNNGCASARPWRIGSLWELPLTLPRDGSLLFLGFGPAEIVQMWRGTAEIVARSGGIVSILTHCEAGFSGNTPMLTAYQSFVDWLANDSRFEFVRPMDLLGRLQATDENSRVSALHAASDQTN
jgi:peptidoglycan/xylan/chitin deacetylase (PgdA/CDA1 family)